MFVRRFDVLLAARDMQTWLCSWLFAGQAGPLASHALHIANLINPRASPISASTQRCCLAGYFFFFRARNGRRSPRPSLIIAYIYAPAYSTSS
jgi:hypothetical protein